MESAEPYKEFIREVTLRIERVLGSFAREAREDRLEFAKRFDALQAQGDKILAEIDGHREETRAQTQALIRLIDRMDSGGPAAAT